MKKPEEKQVINNPPACFAFTACFRLQGFQPNFQGSLQILREPWGTFNVSTCHSGSEIVHFLPALCRPCGDLPSSQQLEDF